VAPRILNLGAGNKILPGAVNHDLRKHRPEIDVAHDLNVLPWPWDDNSFDQVVATAVLEHLWQDLLVSVGECWRILVPGGRLLLKLPYWKSDVSFQDPTHYWRFSLTTCDIFDPTTDYGRQYGFYTDRKWRIVKPAALNRAGSSFRLAMETIK
jgi:SAM-dependent methyltransferase